MGDGKKCSKCGLSKPLNEFYSDSRSSDGKRPHCKKCHAIGVLSWRARNKEAVRRMNSRESRGRERCILYDSRYMKKNRAKITENQREYREKNREKETARNRLLRAVRSGVIQRLDSCQLCNSHIRVEAHHPNYSKSLSVEWLCAKCHRAVDRAALGEE